MNSSISVPNSFLILFSFFLFNFTAHSQDSLFFDKDGKELESLAGAEYYRVTETSADDPDRGVVKDYYATGQIRSEVFFSSLEKEERSGKARSWNPEGILSREISYFKGKQHGNMATYWKNGQLRRKDIYVRGQLTEGTCWNEQGEEVEYFPYEVKAEFPGGLEALQAYLKENTVHPEGAGKNGSTEKITVFFVINEEGKTVDIEVEDTGNEKLLLAAYLAVKNMPTWSPGYIDGEAVRVKYALPFRFRY